MKRRLWILYLGVAALGGLAYYFAPHLAKSGPFFNILGLTSVIAIVVGIRINRPARKLPERGRPAAGTRALGKAPGAPRAHRRAARRAQQTARRRSARRLTARRP